MATLVVSGNSDIYEFGWRISVTESDHWDVDIGSFFDSLSVGARIGNDDETRFFEGARDVVGEVTRSESTSDGYGARVSGELENSPLTIWTCGDDTNVGWVVNGCDDASSEDDFFPADGH